MCCELLRPLQHTLTGRQVAVLELNSILHLKQSRGFISHPEELCYIAECSGCIAFPCCIHCVHVAGTYIMMREL